MKHLSLLLAGCALASTSAFAATDNTTTYSYAQPDAEIYGIGWGDNIVHDVAIRINDPSYVGYKILGISVDIPAIDGCSVEPTGYAWLTEELAVAGKEFDYMNIPDITDPDDMPSGTVRNVGSAENPKYVLDIDFDEPYTITENGVYVGYTLTVTQLKNWTKTYPVALTKNANNAGGFYMHAGYSSILGPTKYNRWNDMASAQGAVSTMRVHMEGSKKQNAAFIEPTGSVFGKFGEATDLPAILYNYGANPITSVEYVYSSADGSLTPVNGALNLAEPLAAESSCPVVLPVVVPTTADNYTMTLNVKSVNGKDNEYDGAVDFTLYSREWIPKKRVLIDEYTGTWCGWCPEYYVAVRQLEDKYPDDVVVATYHNSDQLQTIGSSFLPRPGAGEPYVEFDRVPKGIQARSAEQTLLTRLNELAPADISVELFWADDTKTTVRPEVTVKFAEPAEADSYRIGYSLLEDKYIDSTIKQRNFFYNSADYTDEYYKGKYWDLFIGKGFEVPGIQYDGITLLAGNPKGIEGTIPEAVNTNDEVKWHTVLIPEEGVSTYGGNEAKFGKPIMLNRDNLRVMAYLVDPATGKILNAANSNYAADAKVYNNETSGVGAVSNEAAVVATEYYSLDGVRFAQAPEKGFVIVVKRYADGKIKTAKILQ